MAELYMYFIVGALCVIGATNKGWQGAFFKVLAIYAILAIIAHHLDILQ